MKSLRFLAFSMTVLAAPALWAQSAATVPQGYITLNVTAGTGSARNLSVLSFPLQEVGTLTGQMSGRLTGVTANTLSNSAAGWSAGALSAAATPYYIKLTSGSASGRIFLISTATANTATTVTIDSVDAATTDLTTLSIQTGASGDTYEICAADTILSALGTPATTSILDGSSAAAADQIQVYSPSSGWLSYYYNTTSGWVRVGPPIASGNTVIRPDTAVLYNRLAATPLTFILMGRVPTVDRKATVANSGVTVLSNCWPLDSSLSNSNIRNLPGWVTGSSTTADYVQIFSAANGWRQFYHNGTNWLRVGPPIVSDNEPIPAGAAVIITKRGSATGQAVLTQALPYSL
jgi:hypothetical protein